MKPDIPRPAGLDLLLAAHIDIREEYRRAIETAIGHGLSVASCLPDHWIAVAETLHVPHHLAVHWISQQSGSLDPERLKTWAMNFGFITDHRS